MGAGEGRINRERRLMGVTVREELGPKKGGEKRERERHTHTHTHTHTRFQPSLHLNSRENCLAAGAKQMLAGNKPQLGKGTVSDKQ